VFQYLSDYERQPLKIRALLIYLPAKSLYLILIDLQPVQTERSKMLRRELYLTIDPELVARAGACAAPVCALPRE
jgi:hypothetical protein